MSDCHTVHKRPAETTDAFLRRYLETVTEQMQRERRRFGRQVARYGCYEHLVLDLGQPFIANRLPPTIYQGWPKLCYQNTLDLVRALPDLLRYVEGFAIDSMTGQPWLHAWAVTADGRVLDRTWPDPERGGYFGIVFDWKTVQRFDNLGEDYLGIIESQYLLGNPLMRTGKLFPEDDHA